MYIKVIFESFTCYADKFANMKKIEILFDNSINNNNPIPTTEKDINERTEQQ